MKLKDRLRAVAALIVTAVVAGACADAKAAQPEMTVYSTPTCGCCGAWVDHLREDGFTVTVIHQNDLSGIRARHRLPGELVSCHMGVVDGFAVEGHVPAAAIRRLLRERPEVLGIAVPGMPAGSPGMEMPNGYVQPYEVYSYDAAGGIAVFESIR